MQETITTIRKSLKSICKTLSVRRGTGTARWWIEIGGSGEFGNFTDAEKSALASVNLPRGGNIAVIAPEDQKYWAETLSAK